ncbi:MAG: viperin family antiviral radical SAM protein, partial [Clostridia bacterium]|nr:viperin family antiviral radical SAM protein [Clostridia bacterium]
CNYSCVYCFAKSNIKEKELSFDKCKNVVDKIQKYFEENNIKDGRINLVGGEPLVSPFINELIDYCFNKKIKVSIVTNGSLLTKEFIESNKKKLCMIGISIDSLNEETNKKIGRCCKNKILNKEQLIEICKIIKDCGIKLKINTVVSKFNVHEDFVDFYNVIIPDKVKIFQMSILKGVNDKAKHFQLTNEEYKNFCHKHKGENVFIETEDDMQNSYLMIDRFGNFVVNDKGEQKCCGSVLNDSLTLLIRKSNFDNEKFIKRYGGAKNV